MLKKIIWHGAAIVWMIVIFLMSSQPGEASSDLSGSFSYMLVDTFEEVFSLEWEEDRIVMVAQEIDYPLRKVAHMCEFGILAVLLFGAFGQYQKVQSTKLRYGMAVLVSALYAATDEWHQVYVPLRKGCFTDVLIDAAGAVLALCVLAVMVRLWKRIQIKR